MKSAGCHKALRRGRQWCPVPNAVRAGSRWRVPAYCFGRAKSHPVPLWHSMRIGESCPSPWHWLPRGLNRSGGSRKHCLLWAWRFRAGWCCPKNLHGRWWYCYGQMIFRHRCIRLIRWLHRGLCRPASFYPRVSSFRYSRSCAWLRWCPFPFHCAWYGRAPSASRLGRRRCQPGRRWQVWQYIWMAVSCLFPVTFIHTKVRLILWTLSSDKTK